MIPEIGELVLTTWVEHRYNEYRWNPCKDITGYELYRSLLFIQGVDDWRHGYKHQACSKNMCRQFEELPPNCKRHFLISKTNKNQDEISN